MPRHANHASPDSPPDGDGGRPSSPDGPPGRASGRCLAARVLLTCALLGPVLDGQHRDRRTSVGGAVTTGETQVKRIGRIRDVRGGPDAFISIAIESSEGAPTSIVRLEPAY